ncbi:MAG: NADH:flavin oxidoreductase [Solidesulfovibrio sp.]|uniref:NADH:flavin oxidoreductase n=1 Tax=Solidesulfovibrio sp. TaxID=2910990 RepID=UPI002B219B2A|nr:NADH:flavin oxidoreductase [Solidesulfovibrio sp.]MEA4857759.1 NADH:flavin oxidoreductase [Solidesulfovibrio sp.]
MRVFTPFVINGMRLRNRFVRSATAEGLAAPDGSVTDRLEAAMKALAVGGVGLVISGHAYVEKRGQAGLGQMGVHLPAMEAGVARLARCVHAHGGRFVVQLAHAGCRADPALSGEPAVGPSAPEGADGGACQAMTAEDLARLEAAFAAAAALCRDAGADGVQIHAAHGYGISQFLSPRTNRRQGAYGGSLENRARLLLEIVGSIRGLVGRDFPLLVKINSEDFLEGGMDAAESRRVVAWLETAGVDAVELSGGTLDSGRLSPVRPGRFPLPEGEAWYREAARAVKAAGLGIPLALVGGVRSLETAEELVASGTADLLALSRPLIREPGLVARWQSGDRTPSACLSDNLCFVPLRRGEGVSCLTEARRKRRDGREADGRA